MSLRNTQTFYSMPFGKWYDLNKQDLDAEYVAKYGYPEPKESDCEACDGYGETDPEEDDDADSEWPMKCMQCDGTGKEIVEPADILRDDAIPQYREQVKLDRAKMERYLKELSCHI